MSAPVSAVLEQRIADLEAEHERMRRELDGLLKCLRIAGDADRPLAQSAAPRQRHLQVVR